MIHPNNLPEELITFLKKKDALEQFMYNTITGDQSSINYPDSLDQWITLAFTWEQSNEGHAFWSNLNSIWYNQCIPN